MPGHHLCSSGLSVSVPVSACLLPSFRPGLPGAWPPPVQFGSVCLSVSVPVSACLSFLQTRAAWCLATTCAARVCPSLSFLPSFVPGVSRRPCSWKKSLARSSPRLCSRSSRHPNRPPVPDSVSSGLSPSLCPSGRTQTHLTPDRSPGSVRPRSSRSPCTCAPSASKPELSLSADVPGGGWGGVCVR